MKNIKTVLVVICCNLLWMSLPMIVTAEEYSYPTNGEVMFKNKGGSLESMQEKYFPNRKQNRSLLQTGEEKELRYAVIGFIIVLITVGYPFTKKIKGK